jgi:trimethylamine--corrinoid protein Co-methyltransferase
MCEQQYQPRLYLLSPEGIDDLDQAARTILESTGLNVHHPEARQLMMARGARAAEGARLVIPSSLVDRALGTAPREVTIYDRLGRPAMPLGPHRIYFGTGSDLMQTRDLDTGQRRPSTLSDVARAAHLCDALPEIDFVMSFALPHDVSEEDVEPQQYHAMVSSTTKPVIMTSYSGRPTLARQHAMACLVAGDEASFRRRPTYILYGQFVSPLQHDQGALDRLLFCADHEIPLIYVPTIMPGASGPLTLAGSLALAVAESLAGLVLQQARRPGAPFIFGACVSPLDMRTMLFPYGSPEWRASDLALAEVAREYGLPVFGTGGATDSTLVDAQAGA